MSAQVTEAHIDLVRYVLDAEWWGSNVEKKFAQLIADSEARATERANAQVESLISSAKNAIPASEHPAEPTVENWAWQIRNLGDDRRLVYAERDQLRAEMRAVLKIVNEQTARAESAEREVADLKANNRFHRGHSAGYAEAKADCEVELAAEREKVRVLRKACESICEEWGRNHDAPFCAGSEMEKRATAALAATEDAT